MRRIAPCALMICGAWTSSAGSAPAPLDEVVVEGAVPRLAELRRQIVAIEDRFYDLYNDLNDVPEFEVHCAVETRAGTLFRKRYCRAVFEERAFAEEGQTAFQIRQHVQDQLAKGDPDPIMPADPPLQAIVAIEARRPEFRRHMEALARGNPELLRLLKQRADMERRYVEIRRNTTRREPR